MINTVLEHFNAFEIIMFVHELHLRGYEQLRLFSGMSPNGNCWRWFLYPKVLMKTDNAFELHGDCVPFICLRGTTGDGRPKKQSIEPIDTALLENKDFFDLAKCKDNEYVLWFQNLVKKAKEGQYPIAFDEFFYGEQWLFTSSEKLTYPPFSPTNIDDLSDEQVIQSAHFLFDDYSVSELKGVFNFSGIKPNNHTISEVIRKALKENKGLINHIETAYEQIMDKERYPYKTVVKEIVDGGLKVLLNTGECLEVYDKIELFAWNN